jgi:hypothetical protein
VKSEPVYGVHMKDLELKKETKYFHYNEFMEQVNEELKNTSNYVLISMNKSFRCRHKK